MNSTLTYLQNALNIFFFIMQHLKGDPFEAGPTFLMYELTGCSYSGCGAGSSCVLDIRQCSDSATLHSGLPWIFNTD